MSRIDFAFVRKELREISRDRRAVLLSFVLPVFVYPATFSLTSSLERREEARSRDVMYRVAVSGDADALRTALRVEKSFVVVRYPEGTDLQGLVRAGQLEAWVDVPAGLEPKGGLTPHVRIVYHGPHQASSEAETRVREVLEELRRQEAESRFHEAGGTEGLDAFVTGEGVDVATETETSGARAGRMIPLLLVMTLFIGGSSLSTDLFAGEKERGTLETLYLTPVPRERIARAKFLVVWGATATTGILNLASLLACFRLGLIGDPENPAARLMVGGEGIATAFLLVVPLAALVGGVLLGISAFARSLKEAQYYVTPAMLVAIVPGLLATGQDVRLNVFTALIPIANVALAVRDGLVGPVAPGLLALVAAASVAWGYLAMRWTTRVLSREDTILGFDPEPLLSNTVAGRRRAAFLGMSLTVLAYFYVGGLMQARSMIAGIAWSLWGLLPLLGLLAGVLAWNGGKVVELLSLRKPTLRDVLAGLCFGVGLVVPMLKGVAPLQAHLLPSPEGLFEPLTGPFEKLSMGSLVFLLAVSPGINEELVFRGVFLGILRRVGSTRGAVIASSAFFALMHLSVFRFVPTLLLGVILALLVVRTGSIFPAMIAHATYNGSALLVERIPGAEQALGGAGGWVGSAALLAVAVVLLLRRSSTT